MKVAIDIGGTMGGHAVRGIGYYTKGLITALDKISLEEKDFRLFPVNASRVDISKYDIIHYTVFHPYILSIPLSFQKPSILTIHDLTYLIYPDRYPPGIRGRAIYLLQKNIIKKCSGVVTISETSKKDIVRFLGIPQEKIAVVYGGVKSIYKKVHDLKRLEVVRSKYDLPKRFVLYVGDVNYNKNIATLAKACKLIDTCLVIVGKQAVDERVDFTHMENRPFGEFLKMYGNDPLVKRLGFVEDEDLLHIYNLASVFCQPSFYEGFGMSVLEAFACETPVVVSKTQALVEIAGGGAQIADTNNPEDFAEKIKSLFGSSSLSLKMTRQGRKRLEDFSWEKTADLTYNFYKKILESSRP